MDVEFEPFEITTSSPCTEVLLLTEGQTTKKSQIRMKIRSCRTINIRETLSEPSRLSKLETLDLLDTEYRHEVAWSKLNKRKPSN